jgi:hypothetical protein
VGGDRSRSGPEEGAASVKEQDWTPVPFSRLAALLNVSTLPLQELSLQDVQDKGLEHFSLKWRPVERKNRRSAQAKMRQNNNLERRSDTIRSENALGSEGQNYSCALSLTPNDPSQEGNEPDLQDSPIAMAQSPFHIPDDAIVRVRPLVPRPEPVAYAPKIERNQPSPSELPSPIKPRRPAASPSHTWLLGLLLFILLLGAVFAILTWPYRNGVTVPAAEKGKTVTQSPVFPPVGYAKPI